MDEDREDQPRTAGRLLTADDLGERWQVSRDHVYGLARSGRLPVVRLGKYMRFSLPAIEEFERTGGTENTSH